MTISLLNTKLYIPHLRPGLVTRQRLVDKLYRGMSGKLTLISAPAGFGKTTLLIECVENCGRSIAWLTLDKADNDPTRFLAYIIATLQTIQEDIGEDILGAIQSPQPPPEETLLTSLLNDIAEIPDPFALVLDDYHVITENQIHELVTFLLKNLPPQMHLIISSRSDPPWPLARYRVRGEMNELRQGELRFTIDEATTFLNKVMGLNLTAEEIAILDSRTEGWITGLHMAALSIQSRTDVRSFINSFSGSHRFILDYLLEEVLDQQPPNIQDFLLKTSILERMTAPLCAALLEGSKTQAVTSGETVRDTVYLSTRLVQEILVQLDHDNLFIVPLDDQRLWYRYHQLFSDLLRSRLGQFHPDQVANLHVIASTWHAQNGLIQDAIEHSLKAQDLERAADLIKENAEQWMMRSEVSTLLRWIETLPDEMVRNRPLLLVYQAVALLWDGHPLVEVEAHLQQAQNADINYEISGEIDVVCAIIDSYQGNIENSVKLIRRGFEQIPNDRYFFRGFASATLGTNFLWEGDLEHAIEAYDESLRIGQQTSNLTLTVLAHCYQAEANEMRGKLKAAKRSYGLALQEGADGLGRPLPVTGVALIGLGNLLYEWNDLENAATHFQEGIALASRWAKVTTYNGYKGLAIVQQSQGDMEGAREALRKAQEITVQFDAMEMDDLIVAANQALVWLRGGELDKAIAWANEHPLRIEFGRGAEEKQGKVSPLSFLEARLAIILARVWIAQGMRESNNSYLADVVFFLSTIQTQAQAAGWGRIEIISWIYLSLAFQALEDNNRALTFLERALTRCAPEGYMRLFLDEGRPMKALLQGILRAGIETTYVNQLLTAFETESLGEFPGAKVDKRIALGHPQTLADPLSNRELQVLRLLTTNLTSTEMAEELYVSVSTVRTHIKNIYNKLDVHRRYEAVELGKKLGLL
jgi:LuxR family maltose regulon positive regulatory protein